MHLQNYQSRLLILISTVLLTLFLAMSSHAGLFGSDKPDTKELKKAFQAELQGSLELVDFEVEILENMGSKVEPKWGSRFKAVVKTTVPAYVKDGEEENITFIKLQDKKGTEVEVYGKIFSTVFQGKWKHEFHIDGNPFSGLGEPIEAFEGKVLVRGSDEEKAYFLKIKQEKEAALNAERQKELKRKEDLEKYLPQATDIIVGKWVRFDNVMYTFKSNGVYLRQKGNEEIHQIKWFIEGNEFHAIPDKLIVIDGKGERHELEHPQHGIHTKFEIVEFSQDSFSVKDEKTGQLFPFTRVK